MGGKAHPGCWIDRCEYAKQIGEWCKAGLKPKELNDKLHELDPNFRPVPASSVSYHRRLCLGMAAISIGRPINKRVKAGQGTDVDIRDMPTPKIGEIRDEALKVFYWRIRNKPESVTNAQLVPILSAMLREGKPERDPIADMMEEALRDGTDAGAPPAPSPSPD